MTQLSFALARTGSANKFVLRGQVFSWAGEIEGLGTFSMTYPQEAMAVLPSRIVASVARDGVELATYSATQHDGRPSLAEVEFVLAGYHVELPHKPGGFTRNQRALRFTAAGREYRYAEVWSKRRHALSRDGAVVHMIRSSWKNPRTIRGTAHGLADSTDIAIALLFECVYTRNLSFRGAVLHSIGRFMDRLGS